MKRLIVLRHAKSGWDDPVARDFDRPLNARGRRAALLMGRYAREQALPLDYMLSSPAVRCAETLDGFFEGLGRTIDPHWERRIYLASSVTLLDVLHETPATVQNLVICGHNPGLEDLILDLVPEEPLCPLRDAVEAKFPTAAIAVLAWEGDDWSGLANGATRLESFVRPRDLDASLGPDAED